MLADSAALLLDFDGPVCSVFSGFPAPAVVEQLCVVLADGGFGELPPEIEKSEDPFDVLSYAATLGETEARFVNAAFTAHEVEAITSAVPTPSAHDFLRFWSVTGRPLAIVSNNSILAIEAYLDMHNLRPYVAHISARSTPNPAILKPSPYLLDNAMTALGAAPDDSVMVGDSTTDIDAGRAAGVSVIGYANKPGKVTRLTEAGAAYVIISMTELVEALPSA
ncbi:MAG TPA: HAD family phosphatase [Pseudonocardiaceae bacterium]|nr:HAD family phosphatase [Pseudonocardiaceae bacterium]